MSPATRHHPLRNTGRRALWVLLWSLGAGCAQAQALDLLTIWQRAGQQDATWQAAQATASAGREVVDVARAELRPQIALAASRSHNEVRYADETTVQRYQSGSQSLTLRQPLYNRRLQAGLAKAQADARDVDARLEQERGNLLTRVTDAYFQALLAQDQLQMLQDQLAKAQVQMDAAAKGLVAGSGTRTDVDEAQSRRDLLQAQVLEARQAREWGLQVLQDMVQQPVTDVERVRDDADLTAPLADAPELSLAQWQDAAFQKSPELQALRAQLDAADVDISRARAGHRPTLDMVLQWQRNERDSVVSSHSTYRQGVAMLQFNMPLYAGGGVDAAVRQALAQRERADRALEAARRDLGSRVTREWRNVTEGRARIAAFEQAVSSAQQLVHATQQSQRAGVRSLLDVLDAQERLGTAQTERARARYQLLVACVRLAVLAGAADEALVRAVNQQLTVARPSPIATAP